MTVCIPVYLSMQSLHVGVCVESVQSDILPLRDLRFVFFFSSLYSVFGSFSVSMVTYQTIGTSCLHPTQSPSQFDCRSEIKRRRERERASSLKYEWSLRVLLWLSSLSSLSLLSFSLSLSLSISLSLSLSLLLSLSLSLSSQACLLGFCNGE